MGRKLRGYCKARLAGLEIPEPFDLSELCQLVGSIRHRPIVLVPVSLPFRAPCGIWAATDDCDYVIVQEKTSRFHQSHIGLHELAHVLLAHVGTAPMDEATSRLLAPNIDTRVVTQMLARARYAEPSEREAEMFASMVLSQVREWSPKQAPVPVPAEVATVVERLESTLLHARRS